MLLRTKVKNRFLALIGICSVFAPAIPSAAQEAAVSQSIGELAVADPRPPVLIPPVLDQAGVKPVTVKIDLLGQRLHLLVGGELAIDSPITSGRKNLETPVGMFEAERKEARRKQDEYGKFVNADGETVLAGVYADLDPVPSAHEFKPVSLDHVIYLKGQSFKIHAGEVGCLPTSDGSIIVPAELAKILFAKIPVGCKIEIVGG